MLIEKRLTQNIPRDGGQLFFLLFDPGDLHLFFAGDRLFWHGGVEQDIGQQIDHRFQVGLHRVNRNAHAVVAGIGRYRSADGFDLIGNLFSRAGFGSFHQNSRAQSRDPIGLGSFGEQAAPKYRAHRNER